MPSHICLKTKIHREYKVSFTLGTKDCCLDSLIKYLMVVGFEAEQKAALVSSDGSLAKEANWTVLWTDDQAILREAISIHTSADGRNFLQKVNIVK